MKNPLLSKKQRVVIYLSLATCLTFAPVFVHFYKFSLWGSGEFSIPNLPIYIFNIQTTTNIVLDWHIVSSSILLISFIAQFILMNRYNNRHAHRIVGFIIFFLILPCFLVASLIVSVTVLKTPFNQFFYFFLPINLFLTMIIALISIKQRNMTSHINAMVAAFVILCSAPIYRVVLTFMWYVLGAVILNDNLQPLDGAAIVTYVLLIFLIMYANNWRRQFIFRDSVPIMILASVLVCGIATIDWSFWIKGPVSRMIEHPRFTLKKLIQSVEHRDSSQQVD